MEVLDIVQSAAFKAGIVSSFNPDEFPGDVEAAGKAALVGEILPMLNCDRTLDITVTSRVYQPEGGVIVLKPFKQPNENFEILGYAPYTTAELLTVAGPDNTFGKYMYELHPEWINKTPVSGGYAYLQNTSTWPTDDFGNYRTLAFWSKDCELVYSNNVSSVFVADANIDFPPMRVEAIMDENSRIKYDYLYRDEFESVLRDALPLIYTTEEYEDKLIILIKGTSEPKRIVLPVPLQAINCEREHAGTIIAPPKFRRYLIDATAVSLAIVYGMSTVDAMRQQAEQSYQMLKKNKPQPLHQANVSEHVNDTLRRGVAGRRFYAGF